MVNAAANLCDPRRAAGAPRPPPCCAIVAASRPTGEPPPLASSPRNVRPRGSPGDDRSPHPDATMIPRWITIAYLAYLAAPIVLLFVGSLGELWLNTLLPTGATLK